jgi:hypothetical protein
MTVTHAGVPSQRPAARTRVSAVRHQRRLYAVGCLLLSLTVGMGVIFASHGTQHVVLDAAAVPRTSRAPRTTAAADLAVGSNHGMLATDAPETVRRNRTLAGSTRVPTTDETSSIPPPSASPVATRPSVPTVATAEAEHDKDLSVKESILALRRLTRQYFTRAVNGSVGGLFEKLPGIEIHDTQPERDLAQKHIAATTATSAGYSASADVQLFVIWHGAMGEARRILRDMRTKFVVLGVSYFDWPAFRLPNASAVFEDNLWRLYGGKGGWVRKGMALKVQQCGLGPFIAAVVLDPCPDYRAERTAHGIDYVNHNMNDAKKLYRSWTGGGFRVHGTFTGVEAQHDIPFLFHRDAADFLRVYRESRGDATRGLTGQFIAWGESGGVPALVRDADARRLAKELVAKRDTSTPLTSDAIEEWWRLLHADNAARVNARAAGSEEAPDALPQWLSLSYQWRATPRPTLPVERLPFGGLAAATAQRHEAETEEHVLVPLRTGYMTMGYLGWRSCRQLLMALRTFKLKLTTHPQQRTDDAQPVPTSWVACPTWPSEVDVVVNAHDLWAVAATIGGRPLDGTIGVDRDPPATFEVTIAGTPHKFRFHTSNRKYRL